MANKRSCHDNTGETLIGRKLRKERRIQNGVSQSDGIGTSESEINRKGQRNGASG